MFRNDVIFQKYNRYNIPDYTTKEIFAIVLLDVGYIVDYVDSPYQSEKRVVFFAILAVNRMMIWETRNKGLYEGAIFSHRDLIWFGSKLDAIENAWTA